MPRTQTPVVSCALAIPHPGLLPSCACKPSAFAAIPLRLSCCPRLYIFRGSITRPASSLPPASYAHCWAGTRSSLLTCWLGVSQVGLVLIRTHPLGNNNHFHEITLNSKVSGLPWREHALVRQGPRVMCACPRCAPHAYWITSSARIRRVGGNVIPSALAVLRLRTSSNFVACSTGRSAGLAPFRRRST